MIRVIVWLAAMLVCLASCTDSSRYVLALPENAAWVSSVDVWNISQKAGLNAEKGRAMAENLKAMLGSGLDGSERLIDRIVENPAESGLDLRDKVYFFVSERAVAAGILVRIADKGKLRDLIEAFGRQNLCSPMQDSNGCEWTIMGQTLVACSDAALLVMKPLQKNSPEDLQRQAAMLLRQKEGEGFTSTPDYRKLAEAAGDVVSVASLELLPDRYLTVLTMGMSAELRPEHVKALSVLRFEDGRAVMDIQALVADKVVNALVEKQLEAGSSVKGTYLDKFPSSAGLWMAVNADGGKVFALLNENPTLRRQFETSMIPVDFEAIFGAVCGDVALVMPDPLHSKAFIAYADVTNRNFLHTFESLKPMLALTGGQMKLIDKGEDAYEFRAADASVLNLGRGPAAFWFGVRDNRFYITNREELIDKKVLGWSLRDAEWGSRVEGKRFFAAANLSQVMGGMDYMTVESADGRNAVVEVVMKDRRTNILQQLLQAVGF